MTRNKLLRRKPSQRKESHREKLHCCIRFSPEFELLKKILGEQLSKLPHGDGELGAWYFHTFDWAALLQECVINLNNICESVRLKISWWAKLAICHGGVSQGSLCSTQTQAVLRPTMTPAWFARETALAATRLQGLWFLLILLLQHTTKERAV